MKNSFGNAFTVTLFGESHGSAIGAVLDGLAPGLMVNEQFIADKLALRRPAGDTATPRVEKDPFQIVSGVFEGKTTGTPLCIIIPNENTKSGDYNRCAPRPGHADYAAFVKYHGFEDYRGGGHFSGRITAALVAAGAIITDVLSQKGITLATHVYRCNEHCDGHFNNPIQQIAALQHMVFPLLHPELEEPIKQVIRDARAKGDSVGGVIETAVCGMPAGVGEPWFDTVEGVLSHALFSVPAVKGVEFGDGFALCDMLGSQANDAFAVENGKIITTTNHNGGINGGITNGMPLVFRCAMKPTPSISKAQQSVDYASGQEIELSTKGRHDPAIFHRACHVVNAVTALTLYDLLCTRYGTDWFTKEG